MTTSINPAGADAKQDKKGHEFDTKGECKHCGRLREFIENDACFDLPEPEVSTVPAPGTEVPPYDFAPWKPPFQYLQLGSEVLDSKRNLLSKVERLGLSHSRS